ncbi:MAG: hypothetical protein V1822_01320 [Candidatus Micrarchaeota archaeon]
MFGKIWNSIKSNHFAMMAVCCLLPVVLILGAQFAGMREWWLYPLAIVVCMGSHILMMGMHKSGKEGGSCHGGAQVQKGGYEEKKQTTVPEGGHEEKKEGENQCH